MELLVRRPTPTGRRHSSSVAQSVRCRERMGDPIGPGTCDLAPGHAAILYTRADD